MSDIDVLIDRIKSFHRERMFAMEIRKKLDLALGSYLRMRLGWKKDLPKPERDTINDRIEQMIAIGERHVKDKNKAKGIAEAQGEVLPKEVPIPHEIANFSRIIVASIENRLPWDAIEKDTTKILEELARKLPVFNWACDIRGFGPVGLASIVAEAGRNITEFRSPSCLWARMGVGMKPNKNGDFIRQGGLAKSASKAEWIAHGYSRQRRARMWTQGHALVLKNGDGAYRTVYLERKEYEKSRAIAAGLKVAPAASISKSKAHEYMSLGHIDKRAQRYMEKRLLKDLWIAWRHASAEVEAARQ